MLFVIKTSFVMVTIWFFPTLHHKYRRRQPAVIGIISLYVGQWHICRLTSLEDLEACASLSLVLPLKSRHVDAACVVHTVPA